MTTAEGVSIQQVRVTRSGLVGQAASLAISGAGWKGARMRAVLDCAGGAATRTLDLDAEIEAAYRDPKRPDQDLWLYRVNFLNTPKGAAPACDADSDGEKGALAFPGVWDARGARGERPEAFSLACAVAAATKCDRWGYGLADVPDLHAACTRMARADYCGDGKSATQRGTEINPWDSARRVQRGPARERARFEAAWTSAGAVCMDHARWPQLTHECGRSGSGLNEYTLPICHSQAEAEAMAGPGKVLLFNESEQHYR